MHEHRPHPERGRDREKQCVQRRMVCGLNPAVCLYVVQRNDEALAVHEQVRAVVVREWITADHIVATEHEYVDETYPETGNCDAGQPAHEGSAQPWRSIHPVVSGSLLRRAGYNKRQTQVVYLETPRAIRLRAVVRRGTGLRGSSGEQFRPASGAIRPPQSNRPRRA
jgi:hypothetical protein